MKNLRCWVSFRTGLGAGSYRGSEFIGPVTANELRNALAIKCRPPHGQRSGKIARAIEICVRKAVRETENGKEFVGLHIAGLCGMNFR
jgi:hypothetical protein